MKNLNKSCILLSVIILCVLGFTMNIAIAQDNKQSDDRSKDIVEDIKPNNGGTGPGSPLYGFKIVIENLGESLTFNESRKLEIQLEHAGNRIAEAKAEFRDRNDDSVNIAMDNFLEKIREVDDGITGIDRNNTGLLRAQKEIVKHRFVLEHLLDDHPNNTGLRRALNNSLKLEDKFESKTDTSVVPVISREGVILREARRDDLRSIEREVVQVEAKIAGNDTEVKVRVEFVSTSTDPDSIAQDILDKLQMNKTEIDNVLEIQAVDFEELNETLEARANAERNISEAKAEFKFPLLKTTNRTDIINGIALKLSELTKDKILNILDFRVRERKEIREFNQNENIEVRAEIIGNATKAKVKVEFVSSKTDNNAIAQEILDMLNLSRTDLDNLLEMEIAQREELKEKQEARIIAGKVTDIRREDRRELEAERGGEVQRGDVKREDRGVRVAGLNLRETEPGDDRGMAAETGDIRREDRSDRHTEIGVGNNFSEVQFESVFILNTADRSEIVDGIFERLSALTVQDVLNSLEKARLEIKQQIEDRRQQEIRHEQEAERGGAGEAERGGGNEAERGGGGNSGGGSGGKG